MTIDYNAARQFHSKQYKELTYDLWLFQKPDDAGSRSPDDPTANQIQIVI